jgi:phage tail sheath protein FI
MPEYLSPGVFVEEAPAGARPIGGVGTSTAAFVGATQSGPSGDAARRGAGAAQGCADRTP